MSTAKVFYRPVTQKSEWNATARAVLERLVNDSQLALSGEIPLKIHTGEPGNISYIEPRYMDGVIDYLLEKQLAPIFMETNMANGARTDTKEHYQIAKDHGFTRIPFVVADGEQGNEHQIVKISSGKHFTECKIATKLNEHDQVIIISHFKGHGMTGFGGAIKMLGIGFASARGKTEAHAKVHIPENELIDWDKAVTDGNWDSEKILWNDAYAYHDEDFMERMAEYALAAKKPGHLHLVFATNLVKDCDCDGVAMEPLYTDLGIFASQDPVAIDKAILDLLDQREGKATYHGRQVFAYAEEIGLGTQEYQLIKI